MPDSDKALRQAVQEEPSNKLHCGDCDRFHLVFLPVFGGEGYHAVFKFFDAAVGNGHPMGIACKIFKDMFRAFYGITQKNPVKVYYLTYSDTMQTRAMKLIATKLETSLALEGELTDKGLSALSESSDSMTRQLAKALLEQIDDSGSLKDMWAAYRRKEIQVDCNVSGSKPVEVKADDLPTNVEKMSVEAEQIGDKVLKVSFTEYVGRRKKTTRIEVKKSELDKMMKEKDGPVSVQLRLF